MQTPVSGWVLAALGVVLVIEAGLAVLALVSLARRPRAQLLFGNKWVWVAVIVLIGVIGPLIYFAVARIPDVIADAPPPEPLDVSGIAESLYGNRSGGTPR